MDSTSCAIWVPVDVLGKKSRRLVAKPFQERSGVMVEPSRLQHTQRRGRLVFGSWRSL